MEQPRLLLVESVVFNFSDEEILKYIQELVRPRILVERQRSAAYPRLSSQSDPAAHLWPIDSVANNKSSAHDDYPMTAVRVVLPVARVVRASTPAVPRVLSTTGSVPAGETVLIW